MSITSKISAKLYRAAFIFARTIVIRGRSPLATEIQILGGNPNQDDLQTLHSDHSKEQTLQGLGDQKHQPAPLRRTRRD